jgi:hypothetical protein
VEKPSAYKSQVAQLDAAKNNGSSTLRMQRRPREY